MRRLTRIDKKKVLAAVRAALEAQLVAVEDSQRQTQAGAVHEESKAENDKDTRALEATYLARGLAERVASLREADSKLAKLRLRSFGEDESVALTALVTVEDDSGAELDFFVSPAGAGIKVEVDGRVVRVVTPTSPVGERLLGTRCDDEVSIQTPKGRRTVVIVSIC